MKFSLSQKLLKVLFGNTISAVIFFVYFIFAARDLSIYQFGLLSILYALSLVLADASDFGTGLYALLEKNDVQIESTDDRFRKLSVTRLTFFFSISPVALVSIIFYQTHSLSVISILCCGLAMSLRILLQTDLRFQRKYTQLGISQVCDRLGSLVFLFLMSPNTANGALLAITISNLLTLIIFRWKPIPKIDFRKMIYVYKQASSVGISSLMSDLALLDILILATISDPIVVAKYSLVARFCAPVLLVGATVSLVAVKELNIEFTRESDLRKRTRKLLCLTLGACLSLSAAIFLATDLIVGRYLPMQYRDANGLLACALFGSILFVIWQVISSVFQSQTMYSKNLVFTVTIGISYLLIILLLTRVLNQYAIPVAQVLVYSMSIIFGTRFLMLGMGRN